jgi:hypothetical protein
VTLVELLVVISLFSVVLSIPAAVLVSVQNGLFRQAGRSGSNDQARLTVEQLDREIRSGNVLYDPANGYVCQPAYPGGAPANCATTDTANKIKPGQSLIIYTQTNAPARAASGGGTGERCVQWRIAFNSSKGYNELQRRDWAPGASSPGTWTVAADHLVNQTGTSPAFAVDPLKRIVNVSLLVNQDPKTGSTVRIDDSVEGRNTEYYSTSDTSAIRSICLSASPSFTSS